MDRSILVGPVAAGFCLCLAGPLAAAQPPTPDAVAEPLPRSGNRLNVYPEG
jgi:hypothetical protein